MFAPESGGSRFTGTQLEYDLIQKQRGNKTMEGLAGLFAKSKHPPYLGGKETGGSGVGGGKTYTITEA